MLPRGSRQPVPVMHCAFPLRLPSIILCLSLLSSALVAGAKQPAVDRAYVPALAVADRFLQAWQSGDVENGMALLTSHAKEKVTTDMLDGFFSSGAPAAYEIGRGKLLSRGRYEFPVVLVSGAAEKTRGRRRLASIVIVDTGSNDWAVDKLP